MPPLQGFAAPVSALDGTTSRALQGQSPEAILHTLQQCPLRSTRSPSVISLCIVLAPHRISEAMRNIMSKARLAVTIVCRGRVPSQEPCTRDQQLSYEPWHEHTDRHVDVNRNRNRAYMRVAIFRQPLYEIAWNEHVHWPGMHEHGAICEVVNPVHLPAVVAIATALRIPRVRARVFRAQQHRKQCNQHCFQQSNPHHL